MAEQTIPLPASNPKLKRWSIASVVLGNALEFYDFTVYAFFAIPIGEAFFPSANPNDSLLASLALFGLGYIMRPIGGLMIGAYADHAGRKPAMLLTIILMAIGMLLLALTPSYAQIGVWAQIIVITGRLIQGLALGGEVGPSTAYLLEAAPPAHRGFVTSWQIASQGCAALFSGILATGMTYIIGAQAMHEWGWRLMLLLGISIVPVGLIIRSHLPETGGKELHALASQSIRGVLRRLVLDHGKFLLLMLMIIAASTVSNSIGTNMPVYAKSTLGMTDTISGAVPIALGIASILFALFGGWLTDRIGRRPLLIWPRAIIIALAFPAFYGLNQNPTALNLYAVTFLMSALSSINAAAIIVAIPESLPIAVRSAGLAIVYALSVSIFGGSTNYIVNKLILTTGDKMIPAYYLIGFSILGLLASIILPETRSKDLRIS